MEHISVKTKKKKELRKQLHLHSYVLTKSRGGVLRANISQLAADLLFYKAEGAQRYIYSFTSITTSLSHSNVYYNGGFFVLFMLSIQEQALKI